MAYPVVLKQLMVSSRRLAVPFRPAVATDMFDRFSTNSRRMYCEASLTHERKPLGSSKSEDADNVYLHAKMPGLEKEDVEATGSYSQRSRTLVIDADKVTKDFGREKYEAEINIPEDINEAGIKQEMKAGILKITLPKLKKGEKLNTGDLPIKIN